MKQDLWWERKRYYNCHIVSLMVSIPPAKNEEPSSLSGHSHLKAPPNISEFVTPTLSLKYPSLQKLLSKPPGYIL